MEVSGEIHVIIASLPGDQTPVFTTAGLEAMEMRNITSLFRESNPDYSVFQPVVWPLYCLSYPVDSHEALPSIRGGGYLGKLRDSAVSQGTCSTDVVIFETQSPVEVRL
jgi:hypothetical protein